MVVPNGVAMCAIHHRAFDSDILGIRPDYIVEVRNDVLGNCNCRMYLFDCDVVPGDIQVV